MHLMIAKLIADDALRSADPSLDAEEEPEPQLELVIPNASCGCVIGRGGPRSGASRRIAWRGSNSRRGSHVPGYGPRVDRDGTRGVSSALSRSWRLRSMDDESYAALAARPSHTRSRRRPSGGGGGGAVAERGGAQRAGARWRRGGREAS